MRKTTCRKNLHRESMMRPGEVLYKGQNVHQMKGADKKAFTKEVQMVFQDPYSSLDPPDEVEINIIAEGMYAHRMARIPNNAKKR